MVASRLALATSLGLALIALHRAAAHRAAAADPADESVLQNTLFVQTAMEQARHWMHHGKNDKAVEILEAQLPRINGHAAFLRLLRDAYRAYIKDLWLANDSAAARRYLERLCILEPAAANDASLRPPETTEKRPAEVKPASAKGLLGGLPFPNFALNNPLKAKIEPKPSAVRGSIEDPADDPFSLANMRVPAKSPEKTKLARDLVVKAEEEFARRRFPEARVLFEKAYVSDQDALAKSRERWAYCMLNEVVERLNQPALGGSSLATLQAQVQGAVAMAPSLNDTGSWLLKEIHQRHKTQVAAASDSPAEAAVPVKHWPRNSQGWLVAETTNFRVFHNQSTEMAERVAQIAERTRQAMLRKWFEQDGDDWNPKCELILHATGSDYSKMTGVPANSPGHSRIETDPSGLRVVGRRMDLRCDTPGVLEAILPHETTHVVLAGMFGKHAVPRWADEGIAVLSEPSFKVDQHRRNLAKAKQDGTLFGVKELMTLADYPQPRRISAFYAQSVCLVEYLTELKGPRAVAAFVHEGLDKGYDAALEKHFGMTLSSLEQRWLQHMAGQASKVAAAGQ